MYHEHFGLKRPLFDSGIAQDQSVFRSGKHEQLIGHFKLALNSPCSVITLTGQPGIGKTTLTSAALRASETRIAMAWLGGTVTNATELLELLLAELGVDAERTTRVERLQLWRQFHSEMSATQSRVFVIAERADDLPIEVLRALDGLTAPDATGYTGANLILLGQAGLDAHLEAPALESLRQRVRLRARLEPFTEGELQDYLRHQVACAGGDFDRVFAPGTVAALYRHSAGVARLANHLCETALALSAGEQQKLLTAALVARVATGILGLAAAVPQTMSIPPSAPVSLALASGPTPAPAPSAPLPAPILLGAPIPPVTVLPAMMVGPLSPSTPLKAAIAPPIAKSPSPSAAMSPAPPSDVPPLASAATPAAPFEFDGGATEVPDVASVDFPVLTDAVDELPLPLAAVPLPDAARAAVAPAARRIETAYAATKAPAAPIAAAVTRAEPAAVVQSDPEAADILRQTQTMRAISIAKSIDDISSSMAETLFGTAELDDLNAALAASVGDSTGTSPAPLATAPARIAASAPPARRARISTGDDLLDLLDLTSDAPLELMDDSPPSEGRKTASQH
jgi:type II secretory pathway predicted ATPase ExeA